MGVIKSSASVVSKTTPRTKTKSYRKYGKETTKRFVCSRNNASGRATLSSDALGNLRNGEWLPDDTVELYMKMILVRE